MYHKEIKQYAREVRRQVESTVRKNRQKQAKFWDYPACVSICYGGRGVAKGYSHSPEGTKWHNTLKRKLQQIGTIGGESIYCSNIVGYCAEQHAGNNYMNRFHANRLSTLNFSVTLRPRTGQVIDSCANCQKVFPNL